MTPVTVRELTPEELPEAWALGRLAFGGDPEPPPTALRPVPGVVRMGAFDGAGRLVAKITELPHVHWWGGREVPAAGVSGVAVRPEDRGGGLARTMLRALLEHARDRGAAVSALYPTVSAVYRSAGWEVAGTLSSVALDTASLRATERADEVWMHRPVDVVRAVAGRGWPAHVRGRVAFRLDDDLAPWNAGAWELTIEDGEGALVPASREPELTLSVRGFAVLYCGVTTGRAAAQAGLAGGNGDPAALDLLAGGSPAQLLDYF